MNICVTAYKREKVFVYQLICFSEMELYKRFPTLTIVWCCLEVTLYPGQIYGWSSLLYILKQEGFYQYLCNVSGTIPYPLSEKNIINFTAVQSAYGRTSAPETSNLGSSQRSLDFNSPPFFNTSTETSQLFTKAVNNADNDFYSHSYNNQNEHQLVKYRSKNKSTILMDGEGKKADVSRGCFAQEARLNLWFSIAVSFTLITCAFLGPVIKKFGMRYFRLLFM